MGNMLKFKKTLWAFVLAAFLGGGYTVAPEPIQRGITSFVPFWKYSPVVAGWTTCSGCVFESSFTTAQGFTTDYTQSGGGCSTGWDNIQAGIDNYGDWSSGGECDEIKASSNHTAGSGGRGFAHKIADGTNQVSGGFAVDLREFGGEYTGYYFRYYMRMQDGLSISGNGSPHKLIYHAGALSGACSSGCYMGLGTTETRITVGGTNFLGSSAGGANGVDFRDDLWHCVEIHLDKSGGAGAGISQVRIDGVTYLNETAVTFGGTTDFDIFAIPENGAFTATGTMVQSIDDLAVSVTDWVGCPVAPSA